MKWKGRRESTNVYDGRGELPMAPQDETMMDANFPTGTAGQKRQKSEIDEWLEEEDTKSVLEGYERAGKIPVPTPRPSPKENRVKPAPLGKKENRVKSHDNKVTPGSWKTRENK